MNDDGSLSLEQQDLIANWLRRILVDFEALDEHIALLQLLYKSKFRYSRSNRISGVAETPKIEGNSSFKYDQRLSDAEIDEIVKEGMDWFRGKKNETNHLILNPVALYDLFDVIDELQPDCWIDEINSMFDMPISSTNDVESAKTRNDSVVLDEFSTNKLLESDGSSLRQVAQPVSTQKLQGVFGESRWHGLMPWVTGLAAAASILAACTLGVVWSSQKSIETQIAKLASRSISDNSDMVHSISNPLDLHSSSGTEVDLVGLFNGGMLHPQLIKDDPEGTLESFEKAAPPKLRLLADELRTAIKEDGIESNQLATKILTFMRSLALLQRERESED